MKIDCDYSWIISLDKGRIREQGTYRGLLERGGDFTDLMEEHASVNRTPKASDGPSDPDAKEAAAGEKKKEEEEEKPEEKDKGKGQVRS